jgi:hypothetical protein
LYRESIIAVYERRQASHELKVDTHVCSQHGFQEQLAEARAVLWTVEQTTKPVVAHGVHQQRAVHLLQSGFVVVYHRKRGLGVFLMVNDVRVREEDGKCLH